MEKNPLNLPKGSVHALSLVGTFGLLATNVIIQDLSTGDIQMNTATKLLVGLFVYIVYTYDNYRKHQIQVDGFVDSLRAVVDRHSGQTPAA